VVPPRKLYTNTSSENMSMLGVHEGLSGSKSGILAKMPKWQKQGASQDTSKEDSQHLPQKETQQVSKKSSKKT